MLNVFFSRFHQQNDLFFSCGNKKTSLFGPKHLLRLSVCAFEWPLVFCSPRLSGMNRILFNYACHRS